MNGMMKLKVENSRWPVSESSEMHNSAPDCTATSIFAGELCSACALAEYQPLYILRCARVGWQDAALAQLTSRVCRSCRLLNARSAIKYATKPTHTAVAVIGLCRHGATFG